MATAHHIPGYRNRPGEHCGSAAMRNLLFHYSGLDLSEAEIFGLGSGLDFFLIETRDFEPGVLLFGRGAALERDVAAALGIDYREQTVDDDDEAWEQVREEVLRNRPTMLSGDIFYLDYRDYKVHFPAHRFVLVGFDDAARMALVADRVDPEPQPCSYDALRTSRNPRDFISTHNLWGRFVDPHPEHALVEATRTALERNARRMLGAGPVEADLGGGLEGGWNAEVSHGLAGLRALREQLPHWPDRPDAKLIASYAARCIEKFGNGGGNFRRMYAAFLERARVHAPERVPADAPARMAESAASWTQLSVELEALAQGGEPTRAALSRCDGALARIHELETRVFESLLSA